MELNEIFRLVEKQLTDINNELGFDKSEVKGDSLVFTGNRGGYKLTYDLSLIHISEPTRPY